MNIKTNSIISQKYIYSYINTFDFVLLIIFPFDLNYWNIN